MKHLLFVTVSALFWQLALQPALAQHLLFDAQHHPHQSSPDSLVSLVNQLKLKGTIHAISPDDIVFSGKKSKEKSILEENKTILRQYFPEHTNGGTSINFKIAHPEQSAAIDQGILFNPPQKRVPAGIVIKPLRDVDPAMIHDPGPAPQRMGLRKNLQIHRKKNQP